MALHPTTPRREKILAYGRPNSGKSSTWVSIADWLATTGSTSRIHLGTTDRAWDAMRYDKIEEVVVATELIQGDFLFWIEWAKKTRESVGRDDWIVVDKACMVWDEAQAFYWDKKTGGDMLADVYFENQRAIESQGDDGEYMSGAHGVNWGLIKKYYNAFLGPVVNAPCHVLVCVDAKEVRKDMENYAVLQQQWKTGWMPAGEKNLPGFFNTWLFCYEAQGGWRYTTARDKVALGQPKRDELKNAEVVTGLVMDYLVPVAGWAL